MLCEISVDHNYQILRGPTRELEKNTIHSIVEKKTIHSIVEKKTIQYSACVNTQEA